MANKVCINQNLDSKKKRGKAFSDLSGLAFPFLFQLSQLRFRLLLIKLCGHIWGVVAAVANIILWLSFGLKSRVSPGLMMLWLAALVYVIIVAVVEFGAAFSLALVEQLIRPRK